MSNHRNHAHKKSNSSEELQQTIDTTKEVILSVFSKCNYILHTSQYNQLMEGDQLTLEELHYECNDALNQLSFGSITPDLIQDYNNLIEETTNFLDSLAGLTS